MKRKIITRSAVLDVEQIGALNKVRGKYWFKAVNGLKVSISELETGFSFPGCSSFADLKRRIKPIPQERYDLAFKKAETVIIKLGYQFPLNSLKKGEKLHGQVYR